MKHVTKVNQNSAAIHNRSLAIKLIQTYGTLSRRQLAQITGLRTSTLTYIVRDLIKQGTIRTIGKAQSKKVGKKQILLEINPDKGWALGVGLEATAASLNFVDASGKLIDSETIEIGNDPSELPALLRDRLDAWAAKNSKHMQDLLGVGVGVPGVVDNELGRVLQSTCFDTENLPLRDLLTERIDVPITIDNDANLAALAESRLGNARGLINFVYFLIITKVENDGITICALGSTIFLDGRIYRGTNFGAGEVSRLLEVDPYIRFSNEQLHALSDPDAPMDDGMRKLALHFGHMLSAVVDLLDTQAVIFGGNLTISNLQVITQIERELNDRLVKIPNRKVSIRPSGLLDRGVSMGAAITAIDTALVGDNAVQSVRGFQRLIHDVLGDEVP